MDNLQVAIVHYHLRTGGVTRIIQHAVTALQDHNLQFLIITAELPDDGNQFDTDIRVINEIGYCSDPSNTVGSEKLVHALETAAQDALGALPDLWHFHNHSLGKNLSLPLVVNLMARKGYKLLLQIHDFIEDGRPENYRLVLNHIAQGDLSKLGTVLYPISSHIHYGVINRRDFNYMRDVGIPDKQLHYLPNPVILEEPTSDRVDDTYIASFKRTFVYPTRAIRRKNIGEFLLWSALGDPDDLFIITRAPQNPAARAIYENWVEFAKTNHLPVKFECGAKNNQNFVHLLRSSYSLVTTSIQEGFGLTFLEPWLLNRPLSGRNIPEITAEFDAAGVSLEHMYSQLKVPVKWIGFEDLRKEFEKGYRRQRKAYGLEYDQDNLDRIMGSEVHEGYVDFGKLNETMQQQIIRTLMTAPETLRSSLFPSSLCPLVEKDQILTNASAVKNFYNLDHYGNRLKTVYQYLVNSPVENLQDGVSTFKLLLKFLAPERFSLLKT